MERAMRPAKKGEGMVTSTGTVKRARKAQAKRPLLVIGCGNWMAGDDAAGLELARQLRAQGSDCGPRDLPRLSLEVLDLFEEAERVLFLDAVVSGAPVGTLHLVPLPWPGMEPRSLGSVSTHGWGIPEIVRLAEALHRRVPKLYLLGIEIESISPGAPLTSAVRAAVERAMEQFEVIREWLIEGGERLTSPRSSPPGSAGFEIGGAESGGAA